MKITIAAAFLTTVLITQWFYLYKQKIASNSGHELEKRHNYHQKEFKKFQVEYSTCRKERNKLIKQLWLVSKPKRKEIERMAKLIKYRNLQYGIGGNNE